MGITREKSIKFEDTFRVGDRISIKFGIRPVTGTVIEDRGHIGYGGRRILRLHLDLEQDPPMITEAPAEHLQKIV